MFLSLRSRLLFTYAILILVILSILGLALFIYVVRNPVVDRQSVQTLKAALLVISNRFNERELSDAQRLGVLKRIGDSYSVRLVLVDPGEGIKLDTLSAGGDLMLPEDLRTLPDQGRLRDSNGQPWLFSSRELAGGTKLIVALPRSGGLQLLRSSQIWGVLRNEFLPAFFRAGMFALILAFVLSIWMSKWIAGPLEDIKQAANSLAGGEYSEIPIEGPSEVKNLADSFNKMASKVESTQQAQKDFIANVSHELKTPLTSIQGFSQAILDGAVSTKQEINKAAGIIQSEAERMNRLVLELLDLARLDAGSAEIKREVVDLKQILEQVIQQFSIQAEQSNIDLESEIRDLPTAIGDPDRLAQVFTNILDNAIKHTPGPGTVQVTAAQDGAEIVVTISDSGPGIPEDEISRIFERFYQIDKSRAKESRTGSGLGLAIVKQIIRAHQGQISVSSSPEQGASFEIRIPAVLPNDQTAVRYSMR